MNAPAPTPPDPLESARCEQCGYPLRGLRPAPGNESRCPECGTTFDPRKPWTPLPWPSRARRAWILSGPLVAIVIALIGSSAARGTRELLVWPLFLVWAWAMLFFTVLWPIMAANSLATDRLPKTERGRAVRDTSIPAIAGNLALAGAGLAAFLAML